MEKEQTVVSKKEEKQDAGGWDIGDWKDEEDSQGSIPGTLP